MGDVLHIKSSDRGSVSFGVRVGADHIEADSVVRAVRPWATYCLAMPVDASAGSSTVLIGDDSMLTDRASAAVTDLQLRSGDLVIVLGQPGGHLLFTCSGKPMCDT